MQSLTCGEVASLSKCCGEHGLAVSLFSLSEEKVVCTLCQLTGSVKGSSCVSLSKGCEIMQDRLLKGSQVLSSSQEALCASLQRLGDLQATADRDAEAAMERVDVAVTGMVRELEKRRQVLKEQVVARKSSVERRIAKLHKRIIKWEQSLADTTTTLTAACNEHATQAPVEFLQRAVLLQREMNTALWSDGIAFAQAPALTLSSMSMGSPCVDLTAVRKAIHTLSLRDGSVTRLDTPRLTHSHPPPQPRTATHPFNPILHTSTQTSHSQHTKATLHALQAHPSRSPPKPDRNTHTKAWMIGAQEAERSAGEAGSWGGGDLDVNSVKREEVGLWPEEPFSQPLSQRILSALTPFASHNNTPRLDWGEDSEDSEGELSDTGQRDQAHHSPAATQETTYPQRHKSHSGVSRAQPTPHAPKVEGTKVATHTLSHTLSPTSSHSNSLSHNKAATTSQTPSTDPVDRHRDGHSRRTHTEESTEASRTPQKQQCEPKSSPLSHDHSAVSDTKGHSTRTRVTSLSSGAGTAAKNQATATTSWFGVFGRWSGNQTPVRNNEEDLMREFM